MTAGDLAVLGAATVAYAVSTGMFVDLPDGRRVVPVAAFGPALIALGTPGYGLAPEWVPVAAAVAVEGIAFAARRKPKALAIRHAGVTALCAAVFALLRTGDVIPVLAAVGLSSIVYLAHDARGQLKGVRSLRAVREELRQTLWLYGVLLSTSGLVTVAYPRFGWAAFVVLLVPLFAARHEFVHFAEARRTYEQTVRGLGRLTERAGYVPHGHHERVSELAAAVGRRLDLDHERIHRLELVALLHDVGAVSQPDPGPSRPDTRPAIVHSGARVLEETGYLAANASFLTAGDSVDPGAPIEAHVLRACELYDEGVPIAAFPRYGIGASVCEALRDVVSTRSTGLRR